MNSSVLAEQSSTADRGVKHLGKMGPRWLMRVCAAVLLAGTLAITNSSPASAAPIQIGNENLTYTHTGGTFVRFADNCFGYQDGRNVIVEYWFTRGITPIRCIKTAKINLVFQPDGNLVVHRRLSPAGPVWSTKTSGRGAHVNFQSDGNLVVYNSLPAPIWASVTSGPANSARLNVQSDGNVVIYRSGSPIWATNTRY